MVLVCVVRVVVAVARSVELLLLQLLLWSLLLLLTTVFLCCRPYGQQWFGLGAM